MCVLDPDFHIGQVIVLCLYLEQIPELEGE